ncbi:30S ribosomal protein S21 [Deltaproteobacteria bacterium IMCC39524]|nr:30S ribosomal protein S21 [Deltaproteobacteria bacterium IMCC39524]
MEIKVINNDINKAMRVMKRKLQQEGVFRELRRRRFHEKPSAKRNRKQDEAIRRERKRLSKLKRFART